MRTEEMLVTAIVSGTTTEIGDYEYDIETENLVYFHRKTNVPLNAALPRSG